MTASRRKACSSRLRRRTRGEARQILDGCLKLGASPGRGGIVLEPDAEDARHRRAAAPEDLQTLAAGDAVGDEIRVALDRADFDRTPGELLDEADRLGSGTHHVADLHGSLERHGEAGEEVAERFLERQTDDGRDDRGRRQDRREVGRQDDLEEDGER